VVLHPRGVEPLDTGDLLGNMQEEYCGFELLEFCCGGNFIVFDLMKGPFQELSSMLFGCVIK
jgi:hypothetical protein